MITHEKVAIATMIRRASLIIVAVIAAALAARGTAAPTAPADIHLLAVHSDAEASGATVPAGTAAWTARFPFGDISILRGPQLISHTFTLRNPTSAAIIIQRLQPSCGCTSAVVFTGTNVPKVSTGAALPVSVPAGGTLLVRVTVDRAHLLPGRLLETVSLYASGQGAPVAVLEMQGQLHGGVMITPDILNFGSIAGGHSASMTLDLTPERGIRLPLMVSSTDPEISVAALPPNRAHPGHQYFTVAIAKQHRLGGLVSDITVRSSEPAADTVSSLSVPVRGTIVGRIAAQPQLITISMMGRGRPDAQIVEIVGTTADAVRGLTVESGLPGITARIAPHRASDPPNTAILQVTATPDVPAGAISTQLIVRDHYGEELQIPVYGYAVSTSS